MEGCAGGLYLYYADPTLTHPTSSWTFCARLAAPRCWSKSSMPPTSMPRDTGGPCTVPSGPWLLFWSTVSAEDVPFASWLSWAAACAPEEGLQASARGGKAQAERCNVGRQLLGAQGPHQAPPAGACTSAAWLPALRTQSAHSYSGSLHAQALCVLLVRAPKHAEAATLRLRARRRKCCTVCQS